VKTVKVGLSGVNYAERAKPLTVQDGEPPSELNYDMWLGPAPFRPYNKNRVHYLFRFFWDYAGGQMTNWGAHHLDIAQWGLGMDDSGPVEIVGSGIYNAEKLYETPQKFDVTYKYANGVVLESSCGTGKYKGGTLFEGEKGSIFVSRGNVESNPEEILEQPLDDKSVRLYASDDHYKNWLDCIKSRKDPICSVEIGHRSSTVCHLGNIAIRSGKKINWDPKREEIVGDTELAKWVSRPYRAPWKLPS
jgi:predicted dehydrogenase